MKRSGPPKRRTELRSKPSTTSRDNKKPGVDLKSRSTLKSKSRVNPVSAKTVARRGERAQVRETTLDRAGWRCAARLFIPGVPCTQILEVDELQGRGREPGSQYDDTKTQVLCSRCHRVKTRRPRAAGLLGLYGPEEQQRRLDDEGLVGLTEALAEFARAKGIDAGQGGQWGGDQLAVRRFAEDHEVALPTGWAA